MTGSGQMMGAVLSTVTCPRCPLARPEREGVVAMRPQVSTTSLLVGASVGSLAGRLVVTQPLYSAGWGRG